MKKTLLIVGALMIAFSAFSMFVMIITKQANALSLELEETSKQLTTDLNTDRYPVALRDNTGKIWIFFDSNTLGGNSWAIWYMTSEDNGKTWSEFQLLTPCPGAVFYVISAIQDSTGKFWVVFSASKTTAGGDNELWFMTSDDGGNTWSIPKKPYEGTAPWPGYGAPTIVEAFGKIWIFFMHLEGFKYVTSDDGGLTWSSPVYFGNIAGKDAFHPQCMRDIGGNLWLFYERQPAEYTEYARNISYIRTNDGATWSQPRNIEEMAPGPKKYPWGIQDSSGRIIVFFDVPINGVQGSEIFYVTSDDGATWSDPEQFTEDPNQDWDATAVLTDEELLVFWVSNRLGNWDIWYKSLGTVTPPPPTPAYAPFWTQWWFWTIIALGITTSVFAFTTVRYRKKARIPKEPKVIPAKPVSKKEYKVCPNCGARLPVDSAFCGKCGTPLK